MQWSIENSNAKTRKKNFQLRFHRSTKLETDAFIIVKKNPKK